ncbi:MAG: hypothetical protein GY826_36575, partial [Fuerstiella sp.]|nr:hypothetical protein [Fuerstiella sp.]
MESENTAGVEQTIATDKPEIDTLAELLVEDEAPGGEGYVSGDTESAPTKFNDL